MIWQQHSAYLKELKALSKKNHTIDNDIKKIKKLLVAHFFTESTKGNVIGPGKIHRITVENDVSNRELWKVEVAVPNLKPNLWPRLWFMIDEDCIIFLAIASHGSNYDNNTMDRTAITRYKDMADS